MIINPSNSWSWETPLVEKVVNVLDFLHADVSADYHQLQNFGQ